MTHIFGMPMVVFSGIGILSKVVLWSPSPGSLFPIDLGLFLFLIGSIFALRADYKIGVPFTLYAYLNYLISRHLPMNILVAIQVVGWILQIYGHSIYEKKAPAFLTTISHLCVGPLWIFAWVVGYYKPTPTHR